MFVIPAIDLMGGKCVRLHQGDPDQETVYNEDPVSQARYFKEKGAELIHVVDLDGAFEGNTANFEVISKIRQSVDIDIEVGGGIRSKEVVEKYLSIGVNRLIVGTLALKDEFVPLANEYGKNLVVGIDAKDGFVATHGWKQVSTEKATEFAQKMEKLGIKEVIYTDIATDGTLQGPNLEAMEEMVKAVPSMGVIASGGVSNQSDVVNLKAISGLKGCIVGKAIYDGHLSLEEAFSL
jgi:phosphoribosylformimino-5-aminoimidazole carboxamide ribotide isomerase